MAFLEFFRDFFTSILVGYLALTNALAGYIEHIYPPRTPEVQVSVATSTTTSPQDTLAKIPREHTRFSKNFIPNFLLEHDEFQRAAVIASSREENFGTSTAYGSLSEMVKGAIVNIYCQYKTDAYIRTTTGTGVFINPKGIILTNAHVAQFLLLKDTKGTVKDVHCVIRSGDPAEAKYTAELLYISPTWIFENASLITEETPRGTGERDYALLYISKSLNNTPLPTRFPSIPIDTTLLSRSLTGELVIVAGYPAEALFRGGADAKLAPAVASATAGTLYTFGSKYADIFAISNSPVGEQGASGGPVVTLNNRNIIGLIVTKGDHKTEGLHSLRAISLSYIDRTIIEETGFSLLQNMRGDVAYRGKIFKGAMVPFLAQILEDELSEKTN